LLVRSPRQGADVASVLAQMQVLHHLQADDLSNVPVTLSYGASSISIRSERPAAADVGLGALVVPLAERAAFAGHAEVLGGVDQHSAVAAADVDQALAGLQAQLLADALELVPLEVGDRAGGVLT